MSVRDYDPTDFYPCPECGAAWNEDCCGPHEGREGEEEEEEGRG